MKFGILSGAIILFFLLPACGSPSEASKESSASSPRDRMHLNSRTGELEGFEAINTLIQNRLLDPAGSTSADFAIEAVGGPGIFDVKEMLGSNGMDSDRNEFLHGEPNPFNVMLWQNQLGILTQTIGQACDASGVMADTITLPGVTLDPEQPKSFTFSFHPTVLSLLQALCLMPLEKSQDPQNLEELWLQVVSYDAPQEEALAWQDFFRDQDVKWTTRSDRVSALLFTIFMNPYFILQE